MKKLISCLLVVMMLFTAVSAYADAIKPIEKSNVLTKFVDETDLDKKDLALQVQSGNDKSDLIFRFDGNNLHLVARIGDKVEGHIQFNANGIYVAGEGNVTLLRYATIITILEDFVKNLNDAVDETIQSIPEEEIPTEEEMQVIVNELADVMIEAAAKEEADAATLSAATLAFANNFKPEYILDVKEENGILAVSLRGEAFATALGEAMDELMCNADLAKLVDEQAAQTGDKTFAETQLEWAANREAILESIRTMQGIDVMDENGHWVSHFQIGEENSETKVMVCDMDAWINAENGNVEMILAMGYKNENPMLVYEFVMNEYSYREKLTAENSFTEIKLDLNENHRVSYGTVKTVLEGKEALWAEFGPDYMYMKGPKGGISTSVRETWTGKTRFELVAENAKGDETTVTVDFYEDGDSLVMDMYSNQSGKAGTIKISRIDKVNIEDLSASEKITEITVDTIYNELGALLKQMIPALTTDAGTDK